MKILHELVIFSGWYIKEDISDSKIPPTSHRLWFQIYGLIILINHTVYAVN
jgi:hypothetical protein